MNVILKLLFDKNLLFGLIFQFGGVISSKGSQGYHIMVYGSTIWENIDK